MKNLLFVLTLFVAVFSFNSFANFETLRCTGELEGSTVKESKMTLTDKGDEFRGFRADKAVGAIYFKVKKLEDKIALEISNDKEIIVSEQYKKDDDLVLSTLLEKNMSATIYCYETVEL